MERRSRTPVTSTFLPSSNPPTLPPESLKFRQIRDSLKNEPGYHQGRERGHHPNLWGLLLVRAHPLVGGLDSGFPAQQSVAEPADLLFVLVLDEVVLLVGVFREVVVFLAPVAVGVDVLLAIFHARQ